METRAWLFAFGLIVSGQGLAYGAGDGVLSMAVCQGHVEAPAQCRWIAGKMSIFNGTPAVRIHQRGSKKVYAVGPSEHELMPDELKSKLTLDNEIEADFRVCPIYKFQKNGLREVCVDDMKNLRVIKQP
jgi:hypothetical protein